MKRHINYHKFLSTGGLWIAVILILSSCIKNTRPGETTFGSLQPTVLIPEGGLAAFSTEALVYPGSDDADTAVFHVNYAATNVAPADEAVTLAIDQAALATYNSSSDIQYQLFPDSIFTFTSTAVTVKKGNNYTDAIPLIIFPVKINPKKNYMLPISIKAAPSGSTISGNFGTVWYHLIGNPIAGSYTDEWIRYNTATQTGSPSNHTFSPQLFSPVTGTEVSVPNGTGINYVIDFDDDGSGNLTNFSVSIDPASVKAAGITITGGPTLITADPINHIYKFNFTYNNSSGAARNITDVYTQ